MGCTLCLRGDNVIYITMKLITLTRGQFAMVDDADFDWLNQWKWRAEKSKYNYYAVRYAGKLNGKDIVLKMHRVILGLTDSKILGDHINLNGLDCQRNNLRKATSSQNNYNKKKQANCSSEFRGVSNHKIRDKWISQISYQGKLIYIGQYDDEIKAAISYDVKAIELYKDMALLNFPDRNI